MLEIIERSVIGLVGRVFANGLRNRDSIPGRVIPKTQKWYLIPPCLSQYYKVQIKGKLEQSRERSRAPLCLNVVTNEKGAFGLASTTVAIFTHFTYI